MRPALRRAGRVLVVAPHPDDETIGCAGAILALRRTGARVEVLVVTDGAASHRLSVSHPPARLARVRSRETRAACAVLGVRAGQITMLGAPDGGLDTLGRSARVRFARALAKRARYDLVLMPDPDDAHPDHRHVARAVARAFRHARCLAYGVWPGDQCPPRTVALPLGADRMRKRRALSRHRTQLGAIRDDPTGFTLDPATLRRMTGPVERFRRL